MDFWLIDVSAFESEDKFKVDLMVIPFDFNDDVFFYTHDANDENIIYVWEVYKIDSDGELIIWNHGNWSVTDGLMTNKEEKWKRRSDLQVIILQHARIVNFI
jgi:hypothetical protein